MPAQNASALIDCDALRLDCWRQVSDECDAATDKCCFTAHQQQKYMLIATSALFLFAACLLVARRYAQYEHLRSRAVCCWCCFDVGLSLRVLSLTDVAFVACNVAVFVLSSLHHACSHSEGRYRCMQWCVTSEERQYWADAMAAVFLAHTALFLDWQPRDRHERAYFAASLVLFPLAAIYAIEQRIVMDGDVLVLVTLCFAASDLLVRWWHNALHLHAGYGWPLLVVIAALATESFLLQYTSVQSDALPYGLRHSLWHVCMGLADCCVVFLFRPTSQLFIVVQQKPADSDANSGSDSGSDSDSESDLDTHDTYETGTKLDL